MKLLTFFNSFSAEHSHVFVKQQNRYYKMPMEDFVDLFQILHTSDALAVKQCKHQAVENFHCKEAQEGHR